MQKISCEQVPLNLRDSRVKTSVALSPALGLGLPKVKQTNTSPVLIIGAADNSIAPLKTNAIRYHEVIENSKYSVLQGKVGHYIFLNEGKLKLINEEPVYYRDHNAIDRKSINQKLVTEILAFLSVHLK